MKVHRYRPLLSQRAADKIFESFRTSFTIQGSRSNRSRTESSRDDNYRIQFIRDVNEFLFLYYYIQPTPVHHWEFQSAVRHNCYEIVRVTLQDPRVDPSAADQYAIRMVSHVGHTETVKLLLQDSRVDPSAGNQFAIRMASEHGHTEIVKLLLKDPRVDPGAENQESVLVASRNGHTETVKLLLQDP